jgi:hypothetical protein
MLDMMDTNTAGKGKGNAELNADEAAISQAVSLEELKTGDIVEMAKDKFKSRMLQRSLARGSDELSQLVYRKAEPHFMELVRDQYGNYLSQKILEVCEKDEFEKLFFSLQPHIADLAQDLHGTRAVQKIVEQAAARGYVKELMEGFPAGLMQKLSGSVTGFHVVVKLLDALPAKECEEVLQELCGTSLMVKSLGCDQWGCCVLKKCIDRAEGPMRQKILDCIVETCVDLVQDPYGNYVVQHIIVNGKSNQPSPAVGRIIDAMKGNVFEFSLQKFSSNVLEKCLVNSSDKDRLKVLNEILNPGTQVSASEVIQKLLFNQFGNYVFQQSLEVAKDPQYTLLIEAAKPHIQELIQTPQQDGEGGGGNLAGEHVRRLALKLVKKYPALSDGLEAEQLGAAGGGVWNPYAGAMGGYAAVSPYAMPPFDAGYMGMPPYVMPYPGMPGMPAMYGYGYPNAALYPGYPAGTYPPGVAGVQQPAPSPKRKAAGKAKGQNKKKPDNDGPGQKKDKGGKSGGQAAANQTAQNLALAQQRAIAQQQAQHAAMMGFPTAAFPSSATNAAPAPPAQQAAPGGDGDGLRVGRIVGFWPNYTVQYEEVPAAQGGGGPSGAPGGGGKNKKNKNKANDAGTLEL